VCALLVYLHVLAGVGLKVEGFDRNDYYGTVTAIAVKQYASTISPHIKLSSLHVELIQCVLSATTSESLLGGMMDNGSRPLRDKVAILSAAVDRKRATSRPSHNTKPVGAVPLHML